MTRPVKCPMTVPVAGRTACRALASVRSAAARRLCGHAPNIARFAFAPHWLPASGVLTLCRRKRLPRRRLLAAVSSSFSQTLDPAKRQNRSGKIIEGAPRCILQTVETRQRNMDHGSSPRLYAARSRSISSTSPPKLKYPDAPRPLEPRLLPHLQRRHTIATNPVVAPKRE